MERIPERAEALLNYEISKRERERVLAQETKQLLSWHPWHTMRFLLLSGAIAFALAWFFSFLAAIGRFYNATVGKLDVGVPFLDTKLFEAGEVFPTSTFALFAKIPDFGAIESFYVALGVIALIAIVKLIFILIHWKKIKLLNEAEREYTEELETLTSWLRDATCE